MFLNLKQCESTLLHRRVIIARLLLLPSLLSQRRRYCGARPASVCVCLCVFLSVRPAATARRNAS